MSGSPPSRDGEAAVGISGPPASLARLATTAGTRVLFGGSLHVDGDVAAAKAWKRLFDTLDPDWEEAFARIAGDIPAHEGARAAHAVADAFRRAVEGRRQDLRARLVDEIEALPAGTEVDEWLAGVDRLRADGDRYGAARAARPGASLRRKASHDPRHRASCGWSTSSGSLLRHGLDEIDLGEAKHIPPGPVPATSRPARGCGRRHAGRRAAACASALRWRTSADDPSSSSARCVLHPARPAAEDIADELWPAAGSRAPFPSARARADRRAATGAARSRSCSRASTPMPMASASIAQVHGARAGGRAQRRRQGAATRRRRADRAATSA
ncbi:MAG: hypothetical protein U5K33_02180 [Halofilum sp. (in: g-proteobacteria)]|nr:hypothetical protein [Halofilum sp. (in: g-proteobacteria)]